MSNIKIRDCLQLNYYCVKMKLIILFALFGSIACRLRDHANRIYIGSALHSGHLAEDSTYKQIAGDEFNCLTPEYEMKWAQVEPNQGQYTYGPADSLVNFAKEKGMKIRGHTLIWHQEIPNWAFSLDTAALEQAINTHIWEVMGHYKGQFYAWDVVNEVMEEDGSLRDSLFSQHFGSSFISNAFRQASQADPSAKLYINDYSTEWNNAKNEGLYNLVKQLLSEGVPIHGVGFQTHLETGNIPPDMYNNLNKFAELGLEIAITELDLKIKNPPDNNSRQTQIDNYVTVINTCLAIPKCVGVTVWGFIDRYSWITADSGYSEPCLWDWNYNRKPVADSVEGALQ